MSPGWRKRGVCGFLDTFFNKRHCTVWLLFFSLLLASLGGEGEKEEKLRRMVLCSYPGDVASASLEWMFRLRGRAPWWSSSALGLVRCGSNKLGFAVLRRVPHLRLSPPIRGRNGEFDGGPVSLGSGEDPSAAKYYGSPSLFLPLAGAEVAVGRGEEEACSSAKRRWSWEASFSSSTSAAGSSRPTSKAWKRPILKPVKGSDICLTSFVRPLLRFAAAYRVCSAASGFVPASGYDGGMAIFRLGGGHRGGPDCFSRLLSQVLSANVKSLCVISDFMGFFVMSCTPSVLT